MTDKPRVKYKSSLQHKLTRTVLGGVTAVFLLSFCIIITLTDRSELKQERSRLQNQIDITASQIRTLQDSVYNMAQQLLLDDTIVNIPFANDISTGLSLSNRRKAQRVLARYMHIIDGLEEILIYSGDGRSISSREVRDPFSPQKHTWYQQFLERGKAYGFSGVHSSEPISSNYTTDVISYIQDFYALSGSREKRGTIILNIEYEKLKQILQLSSPMISGYILYGSDGNVLLQHGNISWDYQQLMMQNKEDAVSANRMLVVSDDMRDGWFLALEMSSSQLFRRAVGANAYLLIAFIIIFFVIFLILKRALSRIVTPILKVTDTASKVGGGDFNVSLDIQTGDEIELLADVFNKMVVDIRELMNASVEHEKVYRRMQIENLMLQINPHFIYNTMNSIVYIARMGGNPQIADFANAFISLLQSTLKVKDTIFNTVREELWVVENYIYLQRYRYADKFTCQVICEEELKDCQILNVTLQPIVENAIFHGIAPKDGNGAIVIRIEKENDVLKITVADDGIGMSKENAAAVLIDDMTVKHSGVRKIGVANVHKRIKEIYGESYGMTIESEIDQGTTVVLTFPYIVNQSGEEVT